MAQRGFQMGRDKLSCSICLDLLKDPVTAACGHSYCMSCIKSHWDAEDEKHIHSCPQCGQTFTPRPVLMKSTMLAELVEDLKKTGLQAAPADHCYAGPEDVACDFCAGRRLKAVKSCLQCLVSYCELHLQPHHEVAALKRHKLVDPSKRLQENICPDHGEVIKIFCRTDQQCICYLCSMDEHRGHDTVSAAAASKEKQTELGVSQQKVQQRVKEIETDMEVLQQEVEEINDSADEAVKHSEKTFTDLIRLIENRSSDVKQQIRSRQQGEVSRVKELQEKLQQEITELRRRSTELEQLSHSEDHTMFLHSYSSLSPVSGWTDWPSINVRPLHYFEDVTAAVSQLRDKLQDLLTGEWTNISRAVTEVDVLLSHPQPKTRAEFLLYACDVTLDPNTADHWLLLSEGGRKAAVRHLQQLVYKQAAHDLMGIPYRFQVLSRQSLTGRCYWEVEWSEGGVSMAVVHKDVSRTGQERLFGNNDTSWALLCFKQSCEFIHNSISTFIPVPEACRVGVYLDHRAGTLAFYRVSDTMTLLHRVQTTFTQPLYAGLELEFKSSAQLCELK